MEVAKRPIGHCFKPKQRSHCSPLSTNCCDPQHACKWDRETTHIRSQTRSKTRGRNYLKLPIVRLFHRASGVPSWWPLSIGSLCEYLVKWFQERNKLFKQVRCDVQLARLARRLELPRQFPRLRSAEEPQ